MCWSPDCRAATYMEGHFDRTVEGLDRDLPNYPHLIMRLSEERRREVARLRAGCKETT